MNDRVPIHDLPEGHDARRRPADPVISLVVPFHNEQAAIPLFFSEMDKITAALRCRVEYVCVDDGSRDATPVLLRGQLSRRRMKIVSLSRNFGKEAAVTAGLANARGDAVVVLDADLQDPPEIIPDFIAKWREGYDVVYGIRASRSSDSFAKRFTARAFYALFNSITDTTLPEGSGDFRLMDRRVVDALAELPERNRFMKGLFSWVGYKQTGVAFTRPARRVGASRWSYLRLMNFAIDGLTSFSIAPLRLASIAGVMVSLAAFLYAAIVIVKTLRYGVDVPGYASIMVVMMFLGGVQLLCLGLMGEYLGRLYVEAKERPLYIVADVQDSPQQLGT